MTGRASPARAPNLSLLAGHRAGVRFCRHHRSDDRLLAGGYCWTPLRLLTAFYATALLVIRSSRTRNGLLSPIDRAGPLEPFGQRPLRCAEFGVLPFDEPTNHPPSVLPPRAWLQ
jgi:hypothetical protein